MIGNSTTASATPPVKVVPLLAAVSRVEELSSALAVRLDPIVVHAPSQNEKPYESTVTARINAVGDALQYLLDNIEL